MLDRVLLSRRLGTWQRVQRMQIDGDLRQGRHRRAEQSREHNTELPHVRQITGDSRDKTVTGTFILFTC